MTPRGLSLGHRTVAEADHWILALNPAPELACTHLVRTPSPHVTITVAPSPELPEGGRAVVFPGSAGLVGTLTVAEVLASSAIDRVEVLGGGTAGPEGKIKTDDFVRPQYRSGQLILTVQPAADGHLIPFETRHPTPCCAAH